MSNTMQARIRGLLAEVVPARFHLAGIDETMSLRVDLGIDSVGMMALVFRMEEEFGVDLINYVQEVAAIDTVREMHEFLQRVCRDGDRVSA